MKSLIPLRYRRVLWGTAILACLVFGFVVLLTKIPVQVPNGVSGAPSLRSAAVLPGPKPESRIPNPAYAASPNPESRAPSPGYGVLPSPNPESRIPKPDLGSAAQPRLVEAYGKLPLALRSIKDRPTRR